MGSVMDQDRDNLFQACDPPPKHPDDIAVDRFAAEMKAKMASARRKGRRGWDRKEECTADDLSRMLCEHIEKGDPVDVANFCMMLHQRGERINHNRDVVSEYDDGGC